MVSITIVAIGGSQGIQMHMMTPLITTPTGKLFHGNGSVTTLALGLQPKQEAWKDVS